MKHYIYFIAAILALTIIACNTSPKTDKAKIEEGKKLYQEVCVICHGEDGTKGVSGAKNLQTTNLTDQELKQIITKGSSNTHIMTNFETDFNEQQIDAIVAYVKTLKK